MNKKIFSMLFVTIAVLVNMSFAQIREIPKPVEEAFAKQYNGATHISYSDQIVRVDVYFELNGEKMVASYSNKGTWKQTEKDLSFEKLPDDVKDGFHKSKYADRDIEETKILYFPGDTLQYRIKTKKSGVEKKYLFFNDKGRLLRESITI